MISTDRIKIEKVNVKEDKSIEVLAHCFDILSEEEISAFKEGLCKKLNYSRVELVLTGVPKEAAPEEDARGEINVFWEEYIEQLRVASPSVWAILEGSSVQLHGDIFKVGLNKDLVSILKMKRRNPSR